MSLDTSEGWPTVCTSPVHRLCPISTQLYTMVHQPGQLPTAVYQQGPKICTGKSDSWTAENKGDIKERLDISLTTLSKIKHDQILQWHWRRVFWRQRLKGEEVGGVWKLQLKWCCNISSSKYHGLTPNIIINTILTACFYLPSESSQCAEFTLWNLFFYGELQSNIQLLLLNERCSLRTPWFQQPRPQKISW